MDLIDFILGLVLGGLIGFKVAEYIHLTMFKDILVKLKVKDSDMRDMMQDIQNDLPEDHEDALPRIAVRVEQVNDQLYVYRLDTSEFLCQGPTREAVMICLADRFREDFKIILSDEHGGQWLKENPTS